MYRDPILIAGQTNGLLPIAWTQLGFRFGDKGTHTSRTIMLDELSTLLRICPDKSGRTEYARALVDENCLGKHTLSTRRLTLQRLTELYALSEAVPLFRLLRMFWATDDKGRAQLALLAAMARDPLLRATAPVIVSMSEGEEIARQRFTDAIRHAVDERLNEATLDKVVRNTASSWTQSGHLEGRGRKKRKKIAPTPGAVAFALVLGYMLGARGPVLFETLFSRVLDRDVGELTSLAIDARRLGFLDIRTGGGLMIVSFDGILREQEKKLIYGQN
jgi:hypothetical protein